MIHYEDEDDDSPCYGDTGGASRFFPVFDNDEPAALFEVR